MGNPPIGVHTEGGHGQMAEKGRRGALGAEGRTEDVSDQKKVRSQGGGACAVPDERQVFNACGRTLGVEFLHGTADARAIRGAGRLVSIIADRTLDGRYEQPSDCQHHHPGFPAHPHKPLNYGIAQPKSRAITRGASEKTQKAQGMPVMFDMLRLPASRQCCVPSNALTNF